MKNVIFACPPELIHAIDVARGRTSKAEWLRAAVQDKLGIIIDVHAGDTKCKRCRHTWTRRERKPLGERSTVVKPSVCPRCGSLDIINLGEWVEEMTMRRKEAPVTSLIDTASWDRFVKHNRAAGPDVDRTPQPVVSTYRPHVSDGTAEIDAAKVATAKANRLALEEAERMERREAEDAERTEIKARSVASALKAVENTNRLARQGLSFPIRSKWIAPGVRNPYYVDGQIVLPEDSAPASEIPEPVIVEVEEVEPVPEPATVVEGSMYTTGGIPVNRTEHHADGTRTDWQMGIRCGVNRHGICTGLIRELEGITVRCSCECHTPGHFMEALRTRM